MDNIMDDKYELEALKMMQKAENITKLNDWGKRNNIISSLGIALRSIDDIPKVNPSFREMCGSALLGRLCHRLQIENEIKLTPKASEVEIKEPLFIIGNPRTGSTLMHKLLSVDPLTRSPFLWEMREPINETKEKRQADTIKSCSELLADMPVLEIAHPLDPLDVDECIHILDCDMFYIVLMCASPTYAEMFHGQSHSRLTDMYKFHKSAMQLFETQNPTQHENWTFKSPRNTKFLKQIREVYPDAKFLWIHRDPKDVVSSFMMMVEITQGPYRETAQEFKTLLNEKQLGYLVDYLDTAINVVSEWEKEENPPTVVHCRYSDLKLDPVEMVKKVYEKLGRKYTPEFDEKLKQKIETMETQHNATPYSHCLADANLTEEQVTQAFAKYLHSCKGLKFTV